MQQPLHLLPYALIVALAGWAVHYSALSFVELSAQGLAAAASPAAAAAAGCFPGMQWPYTRHPG